MKQMFARGALLGLLLGSDLGGARADEAPARCKLQVVHATAGEGPFDERLRPLEARLRRAPFREWKTFKLLQEDEREIKPTSSVEFTLPEARKAELLFAERAVGADGKKLIRGSLKLDGPKSAARTMFSLDEGGVLLLAGHKHDGGILIYALSCRVTP